MSLKLSLSMAGLAAINRNSLTQRNTRVVASSGHPLEASGLSNTYCCYLLPALACLLT